jgi:hypothetical protein
MPHTINGSINSAVWLEYSTNGGSTWTRLSTSFPIGTSITTGLLPINVDLKIRLIALCDETKISNVVDYDYVPPTPLCKEFELSGGENGRTFNFTNCSGQSQQVVILQGDSAGFCIRLPFSADGAVETGDCSI